MDDGTQQSSNASPQIASKRNCINHNGWPQAWSAIGQPSNSWPANIGKLRLPRTTGHNVSHSCLKRLIIRLSKHIAQRLPPAHPGSLAGPCMSGQPISTCRALTGGPSQQQAKQFNALLGALLMQRRLRLGVISSCPLGTFLVHLKCLLLLLLHKAASSAYLTKWCF